MQQEWLKYEIYNQHCNSNARTYILSKLMQSVRNISLIQNICLKPGMRSVYGTLLKNMINLPFLLTTLTTRKPYLLQYSLTNMNPKKRIQTKG
jgi:hypothetical protein